MNEEIIIGLLALVIFSYFLMINIIYFLAPTKILKEFPKKCPNSTKCTRVADTKTRGYGLETIKLKKGVEQTQQKISEIIKNETSMKIIFTKKGFMHAVDKTAFFKFHDDITINIFEEKNKTNVWLQSQSRLGIYDFSVNEKRIQMIHKKISEIS